MIKDRGGAGLTSPNSPTNPSGGVNVEDVFSTYVYAGNNSTQDIVNGIDLADEGGMVWVKDREAAGWHKLFDTERGGGNVLYSNDTSAEVSNDVGLATFNTDGYTTGNINTNETVSWTFRKAPRFFDMVKYTGNGVAGREIAHELGCDVGMMIVKNTSNAYNWRVYHKTQGATKYGVLDATNAFGLSSVEWNDTEPTSTAFTLGISTNTNANGHTYIAYLFADDPLGASGDGSDGMIACGTYEGNGSADGPEIDLGWEPQYLLIKRAVGGTGSWIVYDSMRGMPTSGNSLELQADSSNAEDGYFGVSNEIDLTSTGFKLKQAYQEINKSGDTYIYMAIRRPMKEPESSSEVLATTKGNTAGSPWFTSSFPVDMGFLRQPAGADNTILSTRLLQGTRLLTNTTNSELAQSNAQFDYMDGMYNGASTDVYTGWMFKRATSFFDVVAYTGDGVAGRTVSHNLGVVPEMVIYKSRNNTSNWTVYLNYDYEMYLNMNVALQGPGYSGNHGQQTETNIVVQGSSNTSTYTFIAYLFATLAGISKVGSYTGQATPITIDAGFSTGTKFLIVKRTDSTGDWIMVDSVRGLDNFLELNTINVQAAGSGVTNNASGFTVTNNVATDLNVDGASYIYYAIAE